MGTKGVGGAANSLQRCSGAGENAPERAFLVRFAIAPLS